MTRPVLIDTDPGCDDAVALALALASGDLNVVGITTVPGNTTVSNATHNALSVLELFDRSDVPVAAGCESPLAHDLETAEEIHGSGGITGDLPDPEAGAVDGHAVDLLRDLAADHGDDLAVLGIGPLTNLATATALDPSLLDRIGDLVVMGGVIRGTGNRTPMAEANFYSDPAAARRVVRASTPRLLGLNVTHEATVPPSTVGLGDPDSDPGPDDQVGRALAAWLDYYPPAVKDAIGLEHSPQHDALAVADLIGDVVDYETAATDVVLDGDARGAVVFDEYGVTGADSAARVAVDVDVGQFRDIVGAALAEWV